MVWLLPLLLCCCCCWIAPPTADAFALTAPTTKTTTSFTKRISVEPHNSFHHTTTTSTTTRATTWSLSATTTTTRSTTTDHSKDSISKTEKELLMPGKVKVNQIGKWMARACCCFLLLTATAVGGSTGLGSGTSPSSFSSRAVAHAAETAAVVAPPPASTGPRVVGEIQGSGIIFKDTLLIESFEDPKVRGVTLYISNFQRPLNERFSSAKNFFSDPAYAAVACARTGPIAVADNINKSKQGEEVFEESRSILFKSLRVQRVYDQEKNTVVYASFNTRLDKNDDDNKSRFKSSICAVNLDD